MLHQLRTQILIQCLGSFFLPGKPLFTGLFGFLHVCRRFRVREYLHRSRFRMVIFTRTLKRERLGVQKGVHSEMLLYFAFQSAEQQKKPRLTSPRP